MSIKRPNPKDVLKFGDLLFKEKTFIIIGFWGRKIFRQDELLELKVYTSVDWGLSEYDMAQLRFPGTKVLIDLSAPETKAFLEDLLIQLDVRNVLPLSWDFFPAINDSSTKAILYSKQVA
jgi:hypothetical protein